MNNRVVVFGLGGQLGPELMRVLTARGYSVVGYDRAAVDITDNAQVDRAIAATDPGLVLNAAAYNQVDRAEQEPLPALQVNALAVRNIALACRRSEARLVHFSTDYVFDGTAGRPYTEDDATHPLSAYAVSKLAGELYAQAYVERSLVIRASGVFGPAGRQTARGNFIEVMLRLAQSGAPIRVLEDHVASPTFAPDLAARTADLVEADQHGVFHVGGGTAISWFDYARIIFETAGVDPDLRPTNGTEYQTPARRPKFSALANARMEKLGLAPMPPLQEAVSRYLATPL